ncbi:hypothetical protein BHE74_00009070 [Ensete ventricosum]|nr:hypothetical protein BHE74_00009070 [Ensete ventricosum]RZR87893.1 hypothetical protein BHM03_00015372 [Ensete ventricosum]
MTISDRMVVIDFISCILLASLELNSEKIKKIFYPHMTYSDQRELHSQEWSVMTCMKNLRQERSGGRQRRSIRTERLRLVLSIPSPIHNSTTNVDRVANVRSVEAESERSRSPDSPAEVTRRTAPVPFYETSRDIRRRNWIQSAVEWVAVGLPKIVGIDKR